MELTTLSESLRQDLFARGPSPLDMRKEKLRSLKKKIVASEVAIITALKKDLGKSGFESYVTEVGFVLEEIGHTIKKMGCWAKPKRVGTPLTMRPGRSFIMAEPYGVVLIVSPWNYPFQLCLSPLVGAIAAGNKVVIKPSEHAPETAKVLKDILHEVFTRDEVEVVEGGLAETQILLKQKFDYIFFTGSTEVGRVIMRAAAENLTPVTLELGGKSPCLIHESADLELTAKRCAWGKFLNAGQSCVAPDFVLVPRAKQEKFIQLMDQTLKSFYGENPQQSLDYGRVIDNRHFDRLQKLVEVNKVVVGGKAERESNFFSPTILKDVSWDDKIMSEEIFGPILPVIPYDDLEKTIRTLVALPKPLAFYVFSGSDKVSEEIMGRIPFGGGCINDTVIHLGNPDLPFGGVGPSGFGSYHGKKSFETFTHYKSVFKQATWMDIPFRYPPFGNKLKWIRWLLG